VKLVPPTELIKARDEKRAAADAKAAKKAAQIEAERQKRVQKLERGRVPPSEMFKPPHVEEGKYTGWNEAGVPTLDSEGKELSKNQVKTMQKNWQVQQKLHEDFLKWQGEGRQ
jgi:cysteinyl-tRNA synthetase